MKTLLDYEPLLRLGSFIAVLLLMVLLEALFPKRERRFGRLTRWPGNFVLTLLNTLIVRLLFPTAAVGFALLVEQSGVGLLNLVAAPEWAAIMLAFVTLDFSIYAQHWVFHRMPALWRIHRMHHTDLDIDASTGVRFHPIEILLSLLIKMAVITVIGAPATAVLLFEVVLNVTSLFNHANLRIPAGLDRALRLIIVTPDMHRVHHSAIKTETDSNFGFNFSFWDRLLGTYVPAPREGHESMTVGLPEFQSARELRIDRMLIRPFKKS
ncbi:MAG: sterol desaturase family protein [Gammaproteobacteria bacterium]|nr:sterol desaturase family protein [Gammaproteobacteria bacterium]